MTRDFPRASNGHITLDVPTIDNSRDPRVLEAVNTPGNPTVGSPAEFTDHERQILNALIDPALDPYDSDTVEDRLAEYESFSLHDDINNLAFRLQLLHQKEDGDQSWYFHAAIDPDGSWVEVGSYLPGTMLHVTQGSDLNKMDGYPHTGLRAALYTATRIDELWKSTRQQMKAHGLLDAG